MKSQTFEIYSHLIMRWFYMCKWVNGIGSGCEIIDPSSNSGRVRYIYLRVNNLEKRLNPALAMNK